MVSTSDRITSPDHTNPRRRPTPEAYGRAAIRYALSELLGRFPDANLLDLSEDQRLFAIERYVALDVYSRFTLDVGKTVKDRAPSASAALSRLKDVKDYIKETISARFRDLRKAGEQLGARRIPAPAPSLRRQRTQRRLRHPSGRRGRP